MIGYSTASIAHICIQNEYQHRDYTTEKKYDVLFICAANVGRSQIAEGFYNHYTNGKNAISAAAIQDVGKKYNYRPHPGIVKVMDEIGIDISDHLIKMIDQKMVSGAKKIVLLFEESDCPEYLKEYLKDHPHVSSRSIKDPHPGDSDEETEEELISKFRHTRDNIEEIVQQLIEEYENDSDETEEEDNCYEESCEGCYEESYEEAA